MTPKIEQVISYMRRIQRKYPGVEVYYYNHTPEDDRGDVSELSTNYITTLDLDKNMDIVAVNVPVE